MTTVNDGKKCECEGTLKHRSQLSGIGISGPTPSDYLCVYETGRNDDSTIPACTHYVWGLGATATD